LLSAVPIQFFAFLLTPIRFCMKWLTDRFFHLLARERSDVKNALSEEELKVLISIGEEEGMLDSEERKRLHELFELGDRPVREIMTPRTDLAGLDVDDDTDKHFEIIRRNHYSQMPVFQNSMDQVIGVVDVQTYLLASEPRIRQIMKKPIYIPETKKISDLLADFRSDREDFAVCVDEHGGTAGVVTLEDILEEIFGEFEDEYSKTQNPIRPLDADSFLVEGKITLDDFNEYFQSSVQSESETTLGGYLMEQIGEIPKKGARHENGHFEFQIQDMQRQRIRTVIVRKKS
jgi:putative hemolysin